MVYEVLKPFEAEEYRRVVSPGEPFKPSSEARARDLERAGLIQPKRKMRPAAPSNKDAARQRHNK
ncbi:MAG TPA: hypothetical protein VFS02_22535 [Telluria sp.]|nr:hypothetical protein [Telluria sp.]